MAMKTASAIEVLRVTAGHIKMQGFNADTCEISWCTFNSILWRKSFWQIVFVLKERINEYRWIIGLTWPNAVTEWANILILFLLDA